eukprot:1277103-Rhodomonas_salina.1
MDSWYNFVPVSAVSDRTNLLRSAIVIGDTPRTGLLRVRVSEPSWQSEELLSPRRSLLLPSSIQQLAEDSSKCREATA